MAKGDYVKVTSEIATKLQTDTVAAGSGGKVEVDWTDRSKGFVTVRQLGRTGKTQRSFTYALVAVRSLEVRISDE